MTRSHILCPAPPRPQWSDIATIASLRFVGKPTQLDVRLTLDHETARTLARLLIQPKTLDLADTILDAIRLADQVRSAEDNGQTLVARSADGDEISFLEAPDPLRPN